TRNESGDEQQSNPGTIDIESIVRVGSRSRINTARRRAPKPFFNSLLGQVHPRQLTSPACAGWAEKCQNQTSQNRSGMSSWQSIWHSDRFWNHTPIYAVWRFSHRQSSIPKPVKEFFQASGIGNRH